MVWTHHGAALDIREVFDRSSGDADAAQCIYRNGTFNYNVSTANADGPGGVVPGVAVSDSLIGPDFEETSWISPRGDRYYLRYASSISESIHYSVTDTPAESWLPLERNRI